MINDFIRGRLLWVPNQDFCPLLKNKTKNWIVFIYSGDQILSNNYFSYIIWHVLYVLNKPNVVYHTGDPPPHHFFVSLVLLNNQPDF